MAIVPHDISLPSASSADGEVPPESSGAVTDPGPEPSADSRSEVPAETRQHRQLGPGGPVNIRSVAITGLFLLALGWAVASARPVLLPIVLALLLNVLLSPLVNALHDHLKLPRGLGAALVVAGVLAALVAGIYSLSGPAAEWLERAPRSFRRIEAKLQPLKEPVEKVGEATAGIERITQVGGDSPRQVEMEEKKLLSTLMDRAQEILTVAATVIILLYFFLVTGDLFLRKLVRVLPSMGDKKRAVEISRRVQGDLSRYLVTITSINLALGAAVGGAMYLLEMPNPLLWGVMAALLNFIPYFGAVAGIVIVALVAMLTFEQPIDALWPPLSYFALTATEGYFITPMVLGRRLRLNPMVIVLALVFWAWAWGLPGALLAVPTVVTLKILCDYLPPLGPLGEFLSR